MDSKNHKRIATQKVAIVILTYLLFCMIKGIVRFEIVPFPTCLAAYRDICAAASLVLLVFILTPLLFSLQYHAKHAQMRKAMVIARIGIGALLWVLLFSIIEIFQLCASVNAD